TQNLADGRLLAGRMFTSHGLEEYPDLVLRAQDQRLAGQQVKHSAQGKELRRSNVTTGFGRLQQPNDAVEQVLLAAPGRCDPDGVEVRSAAGRAGDASSDQGADHADGGA